MSDVDPDVRIVSAQARWSCNLGCPPVRLRAPLTITADGVVVDQDLVALSVRAHYAGTHEGLTP